MSSGRSQHTLSNDGTGAALAGTAALLMGLLVVVLGAIAILMWSDARHARDVANHESDCEPDVVHAGDGHDRERQSTGSLTSYAGAAPSNADALAAAHKPYPAALPPASQVR